MEITEAMKKKGWKQVNGTWVAPAEESTKKVRRIEIQESRLRPGWVKVPIPQPRQAARIAGWMQLGLSREEALVAAGVVKPESKNAGKPGDWRLQELAGR